MRSLGYGKVGMEQVISNEVHRLLDEIRSLSANPSHIAPFFMKSTYRILNDLVLGPVFADNDPRINELLSQMVEIIASFGGGNIYTYFSYLRYLPGDLFGLKCWEHTVDVLLNHCSDLIKRRRQALTNEQEDEPLDLIGMLYLESMKGITKEPPIAGNTVNVLHIYTISILLYVRNLSPPPIWAIVCILGEFDPPFKCGSTFLPPPPPV